MSMLVRTGTMVRSKRSRSPRPSVSQSKGYVNQALTPDDIWSDRKSPVLSASSSRQLLQPRDADEYDDPDTISYGSIFTELHDATTGTEGTCDFLRRIIYIIYSSMIMTTVLTLMLILPLAMISIGVSEVYACPAEPNLPLYLMVGGCLGFIKVVLAIWHQQRVRRNGKLGDMEGEESVMVRCAGFTSQILSIFHFVWFILANYWFFSIWKPNFEQPLYNPNNWCNKILYFFIFYQLLTVYGIIALILFFIICLIFCHACHVCFRRDKPPQLP